MIFGSKVYHIDLNKKADSQNEPDDGIDFFWMNNLLYLNVQRLD